MNTKVSWGHCEILVRGMDMVCPLCGTEVKDGESHQCHKFDDEKPVVRTIGAKKRLGKGIGR